MHYFTKSLHSWQATATDTNSNARSQDLSEAMMANMGKRAVVFKD
jgi:hypothetical protein